MSNKPVTLVYTHPNDPIFASFGRIGGTHDHVECVHIDEVLQHLSSAEWPEVLHASLPPTLHAKFTGAVVINRVFSFEGTLAERLAAEWSCHNAWFHSALSPLLQTASYVVHDPGLRGVSRSVLPLNTQWLRLTAVLPEQRVPKFKYFFGGELPAIDDMTDPMQKSIWSIFEWKEDRQLTPREAAWHRFFVERPVDVPVIAYYLGDGDPELIFPRTPCDLSIAAVRRVTDACREAFRSEMGEVLLYVNADGDLTFAAFSPFMNTAATAANWDAKLSQWVESVARERMAA